MPDIKPSLLLKRWLDECPECMAHFNQNAALLVDDSNVLSDEQMEAVLVILSDVHKSHDEEESVR